MNSTHDYPGYAIFISNENADPAGSLRFGHLLGRELERRSLYYTPHYTLALMGHRRRILVDSEAGVYRYDELIVLHPDQHAGRAARGRIHRQPAGRTRTGNAGAALAHQRRHSRRGGEFLRGPRATAWCQSRCFGASS